MITPANTGQTRNGTDEAFDHSILQAVISNIGTGFVVADTKGNIISQNEAALRMHDFRYEHEELHSLDEYKTVFTLEYPEGGVVPFEKWPLSRAIEGDYFRDYVVKLINPASRGRKSRHVSYNTVPIYDSDGVKKFIVVTMSDMSDIYERKHAEAKLLENEQRYRIIFTNLAIGILEVDSNDTIVSLNDRMSAILGYTQEELLGRTIHDITYHADKKATLKINEIIHNGDQGIVNYEKRYTRKDGSYIWAHVTISGVYDSAGRHIRSIGTVEDITEKKKSEDALIKSESILKQAGSMANLGAWEISFDQDKDIDSYPLHWSDEVFRIFGYEPGSVEVTSELFYRRVHPDDTEKVKDAFRNALSNLLPYSIEHRIVWENGTVKTVFENAEMEFDESGIPVRMIGAVQDITERVKYESEITQKNEELTRFIYTVSHDLKSPLVTIKSFSNYLVEDITNGDKEAQERDLMFIRNAADKMGKLLDELLELSRIGRKEQAKTKTSLHEIIRSATDLVAGRLSEMKIEVKITGPDVMLYGHAQRFIQLYQNLLDNSAKFMGSQPDPVIELGAFINEKNEIVLFIRDNGKGIDPRYHHKIFGLFEKMDVNTEGTGIGLALVKRIVEVHGGNIWFKSEGENKGTAFFFTLDGTTLTH